MGRKFSDKSIKIMNAIYRNGDMDYLEIEHALNTAMLLKHISSMVQDGVIEPLPKAPGQLKRYKLTYEGMKVVGAVIKEEKRMSVMTFPVYVPKQMPVRPGAMDAFSIKSKGISV